MLGRSNQLLCLDTVTLPELPLAHSPAAAVASSQRLHFSACALPLQDSTAAVAQQSRDISPAQQAPAAAAAAAIRRELSTAAAAAAERKRRATLTSPGSSTTTSPRFEDQVPLPKSSAAGLTQPAPTVTAPSEAFLNRQTTRQQAEAQAIIQVCSRDHVTWSISSCRTAKG